MDYFFTFGGSGGIIPLVVWRGPTFQLIWNTKVYCGEGDGRLMKRPARRGDHWRSCTAVLLGWPMPEGGIARELLVADVSLVGSYCQA